MNTKGKYPTALTALLFLSLFLGPYGLLAPFSASALTVGEVVKDLACPCVCPLILEDCNMSCGLEWKNEVGKLISEGKTKQEIIDYFVATYGEDARLTPLQRVSGKVFQYTRGFDTKDWVLLWTGGGVWMVILFFGVYVGVKKVLPGRKK